MLYKCYGYNNKTFLLLKPILFFVARNINTHIFFPHLLFDLTFISTLKRTSSQTYNIRRQRKKIKTNNNIEV